MAATRLLRELSSMRFSIKSAVMAVAVAVAVPAVTSAPAAAFGDTCYRDVKATGAVRPTMNAARGAAVAAWESAVSRRYGSRFANWYYSADRTFDCSWDTSGTRIRCVAVAGPCGRKR